ncbi:MAG: tetratricopeptide repeat protein [Clostridia bacterium]|nr:tetratricopeptide repeat protein [Clostridia bacterium]
MSYDHKLVTIGRSGAYLYHRALLSRQNRRMTDALELLRAAVERSPENVEYRLDLAGLYSEMGCFRQSNRLLLDMMAQGEAVDECCYGLAVNRLGEHDLTSARRFLSAYQRNAPEDVEAEQLSDYIRWIEQVQTDLSQENRRARHLAGMGCDALNAGQAKRAEGLLRRSLELDPANRGARGVYAAALMLLGRRDEALEQTHRATEGEDVTPKALAMGAQVCMALDRIEAAKSMLHQAAQMDMDEEDFFMLISIMARYEMHREIEWAVEDVLRYNPYDRRMLHMRATALLHLGKPLELARRCWQRVLRMDPEDPIAKYYDDCCAQGTLDFGRIPYTYELPETEIQRRAERLRQLMGGEQTGDGGAELRELLLWASKSQSSMLRGFAYHAMALSDSDEFRSILRERLYAPQSDMSDRMSILTGNALAGGRIQAVELQGVTAEELLMRDQDVNLERFPVGERQMLRYTAQVLDDEYGVQAMPSLAMTWMAYRTAVDRTRDPLHCTEPFCAALAYLHLRRIEADVSIPDVCRVFGATSRQVHYYANRVVHSIEHMGERTNEDI